MWITEILMYSSYIPVIIMGISSILLQIICLRTLLAVFSGNELIIGLTLSAWLMLVGIGSRTGSFIKKDRAFAYSLLLLGLIAQPSIFLMKMIRFMGSYGPGEVIPFHTTLLGTVFTLFLLCLAVGLQFPLAVYYLRHRAGLVYALEATGAFIAGCIFTLFLAGQVNMNTLTMAVSLMCILTSIAMLKRYSLIPLLIIPILFNQVPEIISHTEYKDMELISTTESRYGEIVVLKTGTQYSIYSSGKYLFSYPDPETEELRVHLPFTLHERPERALIVGGSPALIREVLRYPVKEVDYVEIDPVVIEISRSILNENDLQLLNDPRVGIYAMDARKYIKEAEGKYDLIILNIPGPETANLNRFYTVEFFKETQKILNESGILYLSLPTSFGYIGRRMQMTNGSVFASIKQVFPYVVVSSEEYGIIAGSRKKIEIDPEVLSKRFTDRNLNTRSFRPFIIRDAFSPLKVMMVEERLGKVRQINTDMRPVSYLYNMMLWSEMHGGRWLNAILDMSTESIIIVMGILLILPALICRFSKKEALYLISTTGFLTMAVSIIIILAFQSSRGYVYEAIGILTGTFMLGSAMGGYIFTGYKHSRWPLFLDVISILLLFSMLMLIKHTVLLYVFIFIAGVIGGGQFSSVYNLLKEDINAGSLYALDLAGSFSGAIITTIFLIPMIGIINTIMLLILMKTISAGLFAIR